jgi:alkaline phosphatase D
MKTRSFLVSAVVALAAVVSGAARLRAATPVIDEIAFGSCIRNPEHPMLERALTLPMDLFIFLGDNIYADTEDMAVMRAKYDALKASRFFRELRRRVPVLATWDDHDMGANDAGASYPKRREAKEEFLRWLDEPADSPRRRREGVYGAQIFGPPGRRIQIVLLDTRSFRGPLKRVPRAEQKRVGGAYIPNLDASSALLGEAQWAWLKEQLSEPAELRLIASSIQFVSEFSGAEAWANLPHEKQRMLDVLRETKAAGVLFVSGDRHWCELSRMEGPLGYPLYDLTASALTEKHPRGTPSENMYRALPTTYHDVNVGHLRIDWNAADPLITWKIVDIAGEARIEHRIRLSELQP